jgi:hypothetical protein
MKYLSRNCVRKSCPENTPPHSGTIHLGLGKGSVVLNDIHEVEVRLIIGPNPGTNHPRMLTALQKAKRNGAKIISVNPLIEAGLNHFKNPQDFMNPLNALGTLLGNGTQITDIYLQVRVGGIWLCCAA